MASSPWEDALSQSLRERFPGAVRATLSYLGQNFALIEPNAIVPILTWLRDECGFDYLVDLTAVDYPKRHARFELVYILYSHARNERVRLKTEVFEGEAAPSVTSVFPGANWLEREVFDMFGVEFHGHPNLRRILMPDEWQGHPLRKDYSIIGMDNRWVKENLGIESGQ
ncbi:MAG TPA: NADH-quinone oxidoreductase subunit C [Bryobacteraceae bacterium]|nr:NADH-quinone oxidoreductase subunit C [Bryobacteraceae bacterium]